MPDIVLTSDVIVGFPCETEDEFNDTGYPWKKCVLMLFLLLSTQKREGTPAAKMPDPVPRAEKQRWFNSLLKLQNSIPGKHATYIGKPYAS